jgi:hypothetical protein
MLGSAWATVCSPHASLASAGGQSFATPTSNNSGATKTTLPMTCPLSSSAFAWAASRIGNFFAMTGLILPSSSSLNSAAQSSRNGRIPLANS